ncbi:hypothetical protein [Clostridium sp. AM49-4BH]|nr:hypothetical protein [Clostridium sp. AM49-4BH]
MITKLPFSLKYETGLDYPITMYDHLPISGILITVMLKRSD